MTGKRSITATATATATAVALAVLAVTRRRLLVVTVSGPSMHPTLPSGSRVLVLRGRRRLRRDQVVVLREWNGRRSGPDHPYIVKRLVALPGDEVPATVREVVGARAGDPVPAGKLVVIGDALTASADSRHWGYATVDGVLGVMLARLK